MGTPPTSSQTSEMTETQKAADAVPISLLSASLILILFAVFFMGFGLSAGFYFGVQTTKAAPTDVSTICEKALTAEEGRLRAVMVNYDIQRAELEKYQKFVTETGFEIKSEPAIQASRAVKQKGGIGGGP